MRKVLSIDERVTIYGSRPFVAQAVVSLEKLGERSTEQSIEEWRRKDPYLEDWEGCLKFLDIPKLARMPESEARLVIQEIIDQEKLKADILFDGNTVWSFTRIIRNLRKIVKARTLYNPHALSYIPIGSLLRMPTIGKTILSDHFYKFLIGVCGSIAHYDKRGWVAHYPEVEDLKQFFQKNEYGKRVLDYIPKRFSDARKIVKEIEKILLGEE